MPSHPEPESVSRGVPLRFLLLSLIVLACAVVVYGGGYGGAILPSEEVVDESLGEEPTDDAAAPPPALVDIFFEPASYQISWQSGRIRIRMTTTVTAETTSIVPLPLGDLALISASLDLKEADLLPRETGVHLRLSAGRHALTLSGSLPVKRTLGTREAAWAPVLAGRATVTPELRLDGAIAEGAAWLITAKPLRIVVGAAASGAATGSWNVTLSETFTVGTGTIEANGSAAFEVFGSAPETFAITLPRTFYPSAVEGDAEQVSFEQGRLVLMPTAHVGRVRVRAEAPIDTGRVDLSGLGVEGAGRSQTSFSIDASPEARVSIARRDSVVAGPGEFRVIAQPYAFAIEVTAVEVATIQEAAIENAHVTASLTEDGRGFAELRASLSGRPGNYLRVGLPEKASVLSATVDGRAVAPVTSQGSTLVPLAEGSSEALLVYRIDDASSGWLSKFMVPLPKLDLPARNYSLDLWLPTGATLLTSRGLWIETDPRGSVLAMIDAVVKLLADAWVTVLKIVLLVLALGGVVWALIAILRWVMKIRSPAKIGLMGFAFAGTIFIFLNYFSCGTHRMKSEFMGANQAALSTGIYDEAIGALPTPVEYRTPESPLPAARSDRRAGGYSIQVQIPTAGRLHRFTAADPSTEESLSLWLMSLRFWQGLIALVAVLNIRLFFRWPRVLPAGLIGWGLLDAVLPGALLAALSGAAIAAVIRILRRLKHT